jgi:hypothetical protein
MCGVRTLADRRGIRLLSVNNVQSSLARRSNQKLAYKFFGQFRVIARIGSDAYKLEFPATSAIHPIFHVSQLKQSVGTQSVSPSLSADNSELQFPERILQRRWTVDARPVEQVLIKWSGMPVTLATWENLIAVKQRFPFAPAWGHARSQQEGVSVFWTGKPTKGVPEVVDCAVEDRDRETENSKVCARTRDTRFIQVRVAKVANPTSCLGIKYGTLRLVLG